MKEEEQKHFKGIVEDSAGAVYSYHVMVPETISENFLKQNIKRLICTINQNYSWHGALMPKGGGRYYILLNAEIRKKQSLKLGSEVRIDLKPDNSKYGMPMPDEMQELLHQDPEGEQFFHQLTLGKQRSLLHLIGKPKSSQKRLEKALIILEHLKNQNGKLDFKILLHVDMKNSRWKL